VARVTRAARRAPLERVINQRYRSVWGLVFVCACSSAPAASPGPSAAEGNTTAGATSTGGSSGSPGDRPAAGNAGSDAATDSQPGVGTAGSAAAGASGASTAGSAAAGSDGAGSAGQSADAAGQGGAPAPADAGVATPPDASTASADCESGDPLELLRQFAPADEELASDYADYLTEELGSLTCATQGTGTARTITQPIFVPPNAMYDGQGETLTADVAMMRCDTSEGEQAEAQRPLFVLAPGARLANVTITYPGCEGVHMLGDNVLDNITWEDAGEDAASVRSYFPGGSIAIINSRGHKAADKMFQFNAPCDVRIENFTGSDMGKLVRQNGGTEFELHVDLNMVTVTGVISAVVQSDSPLCFIRHHALSYEFTGSGDKADRVFRDVPPANVTEY
jgi:Pectate lyase